MFLSPGLVMTALFTSSVAISNNGFVGVGVDGTGTMIGPVQYPTTEWATQAAKVGYEADAKSTGTALVRVKGGARFSYAASYLDSPDHLFNGEDYIYAKVTVVQSLYREARAGITSPNGSGGGGSGGPLALLGGYIQVPRGTQAVFSSLGSAAASFSPQYGFAKGVSAYGAAGTARAFCEDLGCSITSKPTWSRTEKLAVKLNRTTQQDGFYFAGNFDLETSTLTAHGEVQLGSSLSVNSGYALTSLTYKIFYDPTPVRSILDIGVSAPSYTGSLTALTPKISVINPTTGAILEEEYTGMGGTTHARFPTAIQSGGYGVYVAQPGFLRESLGTITFTGATVPLSVSLISGDTNGDNQITSADASAVQARVGLTALSDTWFDTDIYGIQTSFCDLNGDGSITSADVTLVNSRVGLVGD